MRVNVDFRFSSPEWMCRVWLMSRIWSSLSDTGVHTAVRLTGRGLGLEKVIFYMKLGCSSKHSHDCHTSTAMAWNNHHHEKQRASFYEYSFSRRSCWKIIKHYLRRGFKRVQKPKTVFKTDFLFDSIGAESAPQHLLTCKEILMQL